MPIKQDMNIYAKWSSKVLIEYVIHYQLEDGTPVAEETMGSALAETTKSFQAKYGAQLNDGYVNLFTSDKDVNIFSSAYETIHKIYEVGVQPVAVML